MQHLLQSPPSTPDLARILDDPAAGRDPDFDRVHEELDREFAGRRLHFSLQA